MTKDNSFWSQFCFGHLSLALPLSLSVDVRKLQVAILTRSPREMYQTDRILPRNILSRVRVSVRPRILLYVTHLDETSHMSAEFVFRYGPKCMGGLILPILVLLHL